MFVVQAANGQGLMTIPGVPGEIVGFLRERRSRAVTLKVVWVVCSV